MSGEVEQFSQILSVSQDIAIILVNNPTTDQIVSSIAIYEYLKEMNKQVGLYSPKKIKSLVEGVDLSVFQTDLGKENLLISFDYSEDRVDKISYHIGEETKKFYLTIKPKKGFEPLDPSTVNFSRSGADVDLIITIGVTDLESLDQLYIGYEDLYQSKNVISLNEYETTHGNLKLSSSGMSCLCELVATVLMNQSDAISSSIATRILYGIELSTSGLSSAGTSADTLQIASGLMRVGAERSWKQLVGQTELKNRDRNPRVKSAVSSDEIRNKKVKEVEVVVGG